MVWFTARKLAASVQLALAAMLGLAVMVASAQEEGRLAPMFGDGRLVVSGAGFAPAEQVTVVVEVQDTGPREFTIAADDQGRFRLDTGMAVNPGASVKLDARGDQGPGTAAITSVPPLLPPPAGAPAPSGMPGALLRTGVAETGGFYPLPLFVAGVALVLAGVKLRRCAAAARVAAKHC